MSQAPAKMEEEEKAEEGQEATTNDNTKDPKPYEWPEDGTPTAEVLTLWNEVGNGLDKSQTVVWKSAVESLECAHTNFRRSPDARAFVEKYMTQIVGILVDQIPSKIGSYERECVQDSLSLAVQIVSVDLDIQFERRGVCLLLKALEHIFHRKKNYYKAKVGGGNWHHPSHHHHHPGNMSQGLPEVRIRMIHKFRSCHGFQRLAQYMRQTIGTPHFVDMEPLRHILGATADIIPRQSSSQQQPSPQKTDAQRKDLEDDAIDVGDAVMTFISAMGEDDLKKVPVEQLSYLQHDLLNIFDRLVATRREATMAFYAFWRRLAWKLLTSSSLPLKLFGWECVTELIEACEKHRPPPRSFYVQGAGCTFCNGLYEFSGAVTPDGYQRPSTEIMYVRQIPPDSNSGDSQQQQQQQQQQQGGSKLTLFRCTMRSQQKWWFLSEADEEQPGTDRDIDYYQHKSLKDQEEAYPPASGWATCRTSGVDPPPTLQAIGWMVPPGQERNTLEHQLATWAIQQKIVEKVLGDTTSHREVVARSTGLIKFLAMMCSRDDAVLPKVPEHLGEQQSGGTSNSLGDDSSTKENKEQEAPGEKSASEDKAMVAGPAALETDKASYCLQASHLLFAWKTCTRKADAAVSAQVYQLLVSILPLCPPSLAIPLLQAVQKSWEDPQHQSEVGEFCGALAEGNLIQEPSTSSSGRSSNSGTNNNPLDDSVRHEILNLMWAVLTHPEASNLKSFDSIKRYVNLELRRGEKGAEHRERFLNFCLSALSQSARASTGTQINEDQALLMVRLTQFVVESCPRPQADALAIQNNGAFPQLLFDELRAYLLRRREGAAGATPTLRGFRKQPASSALASGGTAGQAAGLGGSGVSGGGGSTPPDLLHKSAFQDRLRFVRHVYGLSDPRAGADDPIVLSAESIRTLWALCDNPSDRESMIMFIAGASHNGKMASAPDSVVVPQQQQGVLTDPSILSPAFTQDVCQQIFCDIFCADDFDFANLGTEGGYKSFHALFLAVRRHAPADVRRQALDVQWRVCLRAVTDLAAQQAMRDLLSVYITAQQQQPTSLEDSFGERIFQCLSKVKEDIRKNESSEDADRAAERCVRILNAAVGQQIDNIPNNNAGSAVSSNTQSTLTRLALLPATATLEEAQKCLPHGLRGQSACFHVAITARRSPMHNSTSSSMLNNAAVNGGPTVPQRLPNTSRFTLDLHPLESVLSVKRRVATQCECAVTSVKPMHITGRRMVEGGSGGGNFSLSAVPEDSVMDELGVVHGCEMVLSITDRAQSSLQLNNSSTPSNRNQSAMNDLSSVFFNDDTHFADQLFSVLLELLRLLSGRNASTSMDVDNINHASTSHATTTSRLIWDLLQAMPTNSSILSRVQSATGKEEGDAMDIDDGSSNSWSQLVDASSMNRAVYVLLTIDALLNPAPASLSVLPAGQRSLLEQQVSDDAAVFRRHFVESGGFAAVVRFFSSQGDKSNEVIAASFDSSRRGNAVALRILKSCLFASPNNPGGPTEEAVGAGSSLVESLSSTQGLLQSLTSMVVGDSGAPANTVMDVLRFLRLLFRTSDAAHNFMNLPEDLAKRLVTSLLVKDEEESEAPGTAYSGRFSSSIKSSMQVRAAVSEMILQTPLLADGCLSWLTETVGRVEVKSETTAELFSTLEKLVAEPAATARSRPASNDEMSRLAVVVCQTLSTCPRPSSESELADLTTGVLCGCLRLLRALVKNSGGVVLSSGSNLLLASLPAVRRWSELFRDDSVPAIDGDDALMDLMGILFDGLLTPSENSSVAICCDRDSRREGFEVVAAAAAKGSHGRCYLALCRRMSELIDMCAPNVRHRWGEFGGSGQEPRAARASKYSGLRNQGCTCYMNSALQQLFMMPELRDSLCAAPLPSSLRASGNSGGAGLKGAELVGRKIALQWETGVSYDALVESFDVKTGMHMIRYNPIQVAVVGSGHQQVRPEDIERLPPILPDEFVLADGRPGKETGIFEIVTQDSSANAQEGGERKVGVDDAGGAEPMQVGDIKESADESASRRLLEEVQRTFIHLAEGSKGRCFDPRALVEACACLKLEFDVWQQNDASEFVTKLLDRLEASLKKWAPDSFKYLDHTFGLKQTRQKICKECGLKTNKEEKLINIDCQIRGKTDIHEALATMTEADVMEGSNKVSCDRCKKKTDTILRTAISTLPNVLVLSLKRFDLDFNTFETVKLNSRCAFGHTLNMKPYTIEGIEALETSEARASGRGDPSPMETDSTETDPLSALPDENYEYKLAGVLVHAGVAQGGHYYSFIRDGSSGSEEKWYRFDDEDVTVFNPSAIEAECFGGKVKKETKWPNGQVHTVEQEQFANALMLFYEKVKPTPAPEEEDQLGSKEDKMDVSTTDGFETFKADVQQTNATHKIQTFLFDPECQSFLKGLLEKCRPVQGSSDAWRQPLLRILLTYVFDIFLYSSDRTGLSEWALNLEEIMSVDKQSSLEFVRSLAKKTAQVSGNWLRTYLVDCPDKASREASVKIFSAAATATATFESEMVSLGRWGDAFAALAKEIFEGLQERKEYRVYPAQLSDGFEDTSKVDSGESSSLGIIFSFVNILLDNLPRCWRFSAEPCTFVRALANVHVKGVYVFRKPLIQCLMPPRLIALATRDRGPRYLQLAFPGVSCSVDVANTQIRTESPPSHHVMPLANQVVANDLKNTRGPGHLDFLVLLEALASLAGVPGALHVPLFYEVEEGGHALDRVSLTEEAIGALTTVFHENCAPGSPGMGQREIDMYLRQSGVDAASVSPQKIADLMSKYPTVSPSAGATTRESLFLSVEGFLAYYKDVIQSNEGKVQMDLHTLGFRPDLSRRSHNARVVVVADRETPRKPAESVGVDIAEALDGPIELGPLANHAFRSSPQLFSLAFDVSEPLAEYLVAASVFKGDIEPMINQTLLTIHRTPNDWSGNISITTAVRALTVIASVPDEQQSTRIALILLSTHQVTRSAEYGGGLLHVLRAYQRGRQTQHYNNEFHWGFERYLNILKDMRKIYPVYQWMNENREKWGFVERDLFDNRAGGQYHQSPQQRGDYGQRETDGHVAYPENLPPDHTDSDMAGPHESEDDDEDSQCDNIGVTHNSGPYQILIENAGTRDVNGTYQQDGYFEGACKYSKQGRWKNSPHRFFVFQCNVSNNTRHWYISIVPNGGSPGTSADIDFYTAPVTSECGSVPPSSGWSKGPEGVDPPPVLRSSWTEEGGGEEQNNSEQPGGDNTQQHRYV